MADLKPIPIPASERWRQFRYKGMPLIVFLGGILVVICVWRTSVVAPTLVGQVEGPVSEVRSPSPGVVSNLWVTRFQKVKAGDPIAEILVTDQRLYDSEMTRLRGNLELRQTEMSAEINREKLAIDYQDLRMKYFEWKVQLAGDEAELVQRESELQRVEKLLGENLVSHSEFELAKRNRDVISAKLKETKVLVAEVEGRLEKATTVVNKLPKLGTEAPLSQILRSIEGDRDRWGSLKIEPLVLRAPIAGVVSMVWRRAGESIVAGEPIVTIASETGDRIVSYVRQPLSFEPKEGTPVKVRMRSILREESIAKITHVGVNLEYIILPLSRLGLSNELGLPIAVSLPPGIKSRPGELVDLMVDVSR